MLLNNEWVKNEIKEEIKRYLEKNENENTTQNLQGNTSTGIQGKQSLEGNLYNYRPNLINKKNLKQSNFTLKGTRKLTTNKTQTGLSKKQR